MGIVGGIVGVNGAKTRAHVISLPRPQGLLSYQAVLAARRGRL